MAKWKRAAGADLPPPDPPPSHPGRFVSYQQRPGVYVVQAWPRKRPHRSAAQLQQEAEFKLLVDAQKAVLAEDRVAAEYIAHGSKYTWRDVISLFMTGRFTEYDNYGDMVAQYNLDIITVTPGSFVMRGADEWGGLAPGSNGDVMTMVSGVPTWKPPTPPASGGIVASLAIASATQLIPAATFTTLNKWTVTGGYDPIAVFNASFPDRATVPSGYTWARASFAVTTNADTTKWAAQVRKNGSTGFPGFRMWKSTGDRCYVETGWVQVVAGDYFDAQVFPYVGTPTVASGIPSNFQLELRN